MLNPKFAANTFPTENGSSCSLWISCHFVLVTNSEIWTWSFMQQQFQILKKFVVANFTNFSNGVLGLLNKRNTEINKLVLLNTIIIYKFDYFNFCLNVFKTKQKNKSEFFLLVFLSYFSLRTVYLCHLYGLICHNLSSIFCLPSFCMMCMIKTYRFK